MIVFRNKLSSQKAGTTSSFNFFLCLKTLTKERYNTNKMVSLLTSLLKNFAFTTIGIRGKRPFPSTL